MDLENAVLETMRSYLRECGREECVVEPDSDIMMDLELSSLELMEVVALLEEDYGIHVGERELGSLVQVADIIDMVRRKTAD